MLFKSSRAIQQLGLVAFVLFAIMIVLWTLLPRRQDKISRSQDATKSPISDWTVDPPVASSKGLILIKERLFEIHAVNYNEEQLEEFRRSKEQQARELHLKKEQQLLMKQ